MNETQIFIFWQINESFERNCRQTRNKAAKYLFIWSTDFKSFSYELILNINLFSRFVKWFNPCKIIIIQFLSSSRRLLELKYLCTINFSMTSNQNFISSSEMSASNVSYNINNNYMEVLFQTINDSLRSILSILRPLIAIHLR